MTDDQKAFVLAALQDQPLLPTRALSTIRKTNFTAELLLSQPLDARFHFIEDPVEVRYRMEIEASNSLLAGELQRRGLRFLPKQALKRALRAQSQRKSEANGFRLSTDKVTTTTV